MQTMKGLASPVSAANGALASICLQLHPRDPHTAECALYPGNLLQALSTAQTDQLGFFVSHTVSKSKVGFDYACVCMDTLTI